MALFIKVNGVCINADEEGRSQKNFKILAFIVHSWYRIAEWPADSKEAALREFKKANPKAEAQYGELKAEEI